jgi:hypothetical protein
MKSLKEVYDSKDRSRLEVGWAAISEIEARVEEENNSGETAPMRTILSSILDELSEEYSVYHKSTAACRAYLRDSVRLSRYFTKDKVSELEQYHLKSSHMLACIIAGEWPDANEAATRLLVDWAIENQATPEMLWEHRKANEEEVTLDV